MIIVNSASGNLFEITKFFMQGGKPTPLVSMSNVGVEDMATYLKQEGVDHEDVDVAVDAFNMRKAKAVTFKDNGQLSYILENNA